MGVTENDVSVDDVILGVDIVNERIKIVIFILQTIFTRVFLISVIFVI